jgi:hypothetical protein
MFTVPKLLAQIVPAAATLTAFYTVPASSRCHGHKLFVCNAAAVATTFRIAVAPNSEPDGPKHYLYYDAALAGNETKTLELDLRLSANDLIRVYTPAANVSFNLFGTEQT